MDKIELESINECENFLLKDIVKRISSRGNNSGFRYRTNEKQKQINR